MNKEERRRIRVHVFPFLFFFTPGRLHRQEQLDKMEDAILVKERRSLVALCVCVFIFIFSPVSPSSFASFFSVFEWTGGKFPSKNF